jgi:hypothetical protein
VGYGVGVVTAKREAGLREFRRGGHRVPSPPWGPRRAKDPALTRAGSRPINAGSWISENSQDRRCKSSPCWKASPHL